jgi:DNA-directed RNA polymerase subunit N (RpoN/RPB10)
MIIPVKCFTCGNVLADKYRYYLNEAVELKRSNNIDPTKVMYLTKDNTKKTAEAMVLDRIGLDKMCCRRHMLTHVDIE